MRLIDPPGGHPWALFAITGGSLLLNVVLIVKLNTASRAPAEVVAPEPVAAMEVAPEVEEPVVAEAVEIPEPEPVVPDHLDVISAPVTHSLARTFQTADPDRADVVSAIYARLFFWDLDLRSDLQKGDQVAVAYEWDGELADIEVATYDSKKLGRTLTAYRFQASTDAYPSWWDAEGNEVARRLENGPLREYEQVTSLIKDRPSHKGMDFKTPVGTDIFSPKAGNVVRADWNLKYNGNCAEIRFDDGTVARFLHLSETAVKPGQRVSAGQRIGATGNTGRSTAPHLHYELERAGRVIDPVDYHGTMRRTLPASDRDRFDAERDRLDGILEAATSGA